MTKVISASVAKSRFGSMLKQVKHEQIIIEVHGEPEAVVISYEEFQQYEQLKEQNRRQKAWEAFKALSDTVALRSPELTETEAYELAGVSDEIANELIEKDKELSPEEPEKL